MVMRVFEKLYILCLFVDEEGKMLFVFSFIKKIKRMFFNVKDLFIMNDVNDLLCLE